jgi:hypothetical protein
MKAISIRNVDSRLAKALERERNRRGTSLNETVLDLLRGALGVDASGLRSNGLGKLAGNWTAEELAAFEKHTKAFEQVDDELWS